VTVLRRRGRGGEQDEHEGEEPDHGSVECKSEAGAQAAELLQPQRASTFVAGGIRPFVSRLAPL